MKRKIKKLTALLAALTMTFVLFAGVAMAADTALYKTTTADGPVVTKYVTANGYIVYNQGSSGYVQYNQVNNTTGQMPFGTPTAAAGKTISRSKTDIVDGTYHFRLSGSGTGQGFITGLPN